MEKKIKMIRVLPRVSRALNVLAAQTDLPLGDLLAALLKLQAAPQYLTRPEDRELFDRVWGQSVLSARRAGKSGWSDDVCE